MECARQLLIRAIMLLQASGQRANAVRTPALYRLAFVVVFAFALAATPRPTAFGEEPPTRAEAPPAEPTSEQIQAWIKQLGDDDFQTRERAQAALVNAGDPAYLALDAMRPSDDPEVAVRVSKTLTALQLNAIEKLRALGGYFGRRGNFREKTGATEFNYFKISNDKLKDADLAPLVRLRKLEIVKIEDSPITDEALPYLHPLKKTKLLDLGGTRITDRGLEALIKELSSIEVIVLSDTQITNDGLAHMAKLPALSRIGITNTLVDGDGLSYLKPFKDQLVTLQLTDTQISDDDLRHLKGFSSLRYLRLDRTNITGAGLQHIQDLPKLEWLSLHATKLDGIALAYVAKLPMLKNLSVTHTDIDVESLILLSNCTTLEHIYVSPDKITEEQEHVAERRLNEPHREKRLDIIRQERSR